MKPVQIGTCLHQNDETKEIYNKFKDYFVIKKERYYRKYVVSKEPSDELIQVINDYFAKIKEEYREIDEFVEMLALHIFNGLSQEEKNKIFEDPTIATDHFGFCLDIRNKYIHPIISKLNIDNIHNQLMWEPDYLSGKTGSRIVSLILNYDYENEFYKYLYGDHTFLHLRRLYYLFKGEYPDSIIEPYADLPDDYMASQKALKKIKSIIVNTSRFKRLSKKYGLTEKQYNECKKAIDKYNKETWAIAPYDFALLCSKKLEPEFRKKILKIMKTYFNTTQNTRFHSHKIVLELPAFVFNQKDAVLLAVENMGPSFKRFPKFNSDDDVIRIALKEDGQNIKYVKKELRDNPEYIRLSLAHWYQFNPLKMQCMSKYRDDEELIKIAIETGGGLNIKYASKRLRDNFEIAKLAIEHSSPNSVMEYLSPRLRDNLELALLDIKKTGGWGLSYYSRRLHNCDEIAEALISTGYGYQISDMSDRIKDSDKIAKMLIAKGHGHKISYMSDRIKDSDKIAEALIVKGDERYLFDMSDRIQKKYIKDPEKMVEELISKGDRYIICDMSDRIKDSDKIAEALIAKGYEYEITYMSERIQKKYLKKVNR